MKLLTTIFRFEWIQLQRQRTQLLALIMFLVVGIYAIFSGSSTAIHQRVVIDTLIQQYDLDFQLAVDRFSDTLTVETKAQAASAGLPQMINSRIPPLAVDRPSALAALSVGQRDINPYYQKVKSAVDVLDNQNIEISNPATLFAGNFDLSFVLIYLMPLLIITMCYGSYAEEKEQGTYALLAIQAYDLEKVMVFKLLFRGLVIFVVVFFVCVLGLMMAASVAEIDWTDALLFIYLTVIYLLFWLAVCYFFIQTKGSSILTALKLIGTWLFFLVILPSVFNAYLLLSHPIPLRANLASYARQTSEEVWELHPLELSTSFNKNNPQYNSSINLAKDSTRSSPRIVAGYYDLLERKVASYASKMQSEIDQRNKLAKTLSSFNPSITLQYLYNATARSGRDDFKEFQKQIASFQKKWKHHLYTKQLIEKNFNVQEFKHFPKFQMQYQAQGLHVLAGSLSIWAGVFIFLLLGIAQNRKNHEINRNN